MHFNIFQGNASEVLKKLINDRNHRQKYRLVVTSPPYYEQRRYGGYNSVYELGHESTDEKFIDKLVEMFLLCRELLTEDGSLWIVIGDVRDNMQKLMIPHRLALKLSDKKLVNRYTFREDIIWYKQNNMSSSSQSNFSQAYEYVLFFSKSKISYTNLNSIRVAGNEVDSGSNKLISSDKLQFKSNGRDEEKIRKFNDIIHSADASTSFDNLPSTSEISKAYGYDPEKHCPTCYRKFKRHATRKRIGGHNHYPIFAVCNPSGKNPGNVWEVSTMAHYGNEHFARFPEELIERIIRFGSKEGDWVLDPFMGSGTTGVVCTSIGRNFTGIDLYEKNVNIARIKIEEEYHKNHKSISRIPLNRLSS